MTSAQLLVTDIQRSVINSPMAYSPYGVSRLERVPLSAFCGEPRDPLTGCYHLGNGYRQFNPALMRFNSADALSPFGKGGLNGYVYCVDDPINRRDPTGRVGEWGPPLSQAGSSLSTASAALNRRSMAVVKQRIQRLNGEPVTYSPVIAQLADTVMFYAAALMGAVANITRNVLSTPMLPASSPTGQLIWTNAGGSALVATGTGLLTYPGFRAWTQLADQHGISRWGVGVEALGEAMLPIFARQAITSVAGTAATAAARVITSAYQGPGRVLARHHAAVNTQVVETVEVIRRG